MHRRCHFLLFAIRISVSKVLLCPERWAPRPRRPGPRRIRGAPRHARTVSLKCSVSSSLLGRRFGAVKQSSVPRVLVTLARGGQRLPESCLRHTARPGRPCRPGDCPRGHEGLSPERGRGALETFVNRRRSLRRRDTVLAPPACPRPGVTKARPFLPHSGVPRDLL